MRLISLAPVLAGGLLLGWAASAQAAPTAPASAPPAEPIFYCPSPPAHAAGRVVTRHGGARHHACPSGRMAHADHGGHHGRWRDHDDVSQSQAFIYRYERALHGLNARAADEAWAHPNGFWPHGPHGMADADGDHHGDHMMGPDHDGDADHRMGPDHHGDGDHMMGPDHLGDADHGMGPDHHRDGDAEAADRDGARHYGYLDERGEHGDHMGRRDHDGDAESALRADDGRHQGYIYERRESETSGGWSSSGWSASERASGGEVRDHAWTYRSGDTSGWSYRGARAGDDQWRDGSYGEVVEYAGRDAHGYLVWPGKTPQPRDQPDRDDDR